MSNVNQELNQARQALAAALCDAVLLSSLANVTYVSGYEVPVPVGAHAEMAYGPDLALCTVDDSGSWLVVDEDLTRAVTERMLEQTPQSPDAPQAALRMCLERLRPIDRDLLLSHYEEGETLAECAKRSGRTPGTLKVTLFRLRALLRRCVSDRLATGAASA